MLARNFILSEIRKALLEAEATTEPTPPAAATTPPAATPTGGADLEKNKKMRAEAEQALEKIKAELSSYSGRLTPEQDFKKADLIKARSALAEILRIIDIQGRIIEKQKEVDKRLDPESNLIPEVRAIINDLREKVKNNPQLKDEIVKLPSGDTPAIRDFMKKTGYDFSDTNKWAQFNTAVMFLGDSYRAEKGGEIRGKASKKEESVAKMLFLNDLEQIMKDTIKKYPEVFGTAEKPKKPSLNLPLTGRGIPEKYCPVCKLVQDEIKDNRTKIISFVKEYAEEKNMKVDRTEQLIEILFGGAKKGKKGRLVDGYMGPTTLAFMVFASKGKLNPTEYPVLGVDNKTVIESLQKICQEFEAGKHKDALKTIIDTILSPENFVATLQDMGKLPKEEVVAESKNIRSLIIKELYGMMK